MLKTPASFSLTPLKNRELWSSAEALLHLEHQLELCEDPTKEIKRLQFWTYELESLASRRLGVLHRVELLRDFFFTNKKVSVSTTAPESPLLSLSHLLRKRQGTAELCSLTWCLLGSALHLEFSPLAFKGGRFLKLVTHDGDALFLDMHKEGRYLENQDILTLLETSNDGACKMGLFEKSLSINELICRIGSTQAKLLQDPKKGQLLLSIYKTLAQLEPLNTHYLAEKALLHAKVGDLKQAHADLKRLFLLADSSKVRPELVELYQELAFRAET